MLCHCRRCLKCPEQENPHPLPNWNQKTNQRIGSPKQICELRRHQKGEKYSTSNSNVQSITILPTYLQFTMMLAVAVAGVPTPLLAMH